MKKNKLIVSYEYEFELFGITTPVKEYKLAWAINNSLGIRLIKAEDLLITFKDDKNIIISNFIFETEHSIFRLFKNKSLDKSATTQGYLLPELRNFDFVVLINGFEDTYTIDEFAQTLRNLKEIEYLQKIAVNDLKSKDNLIF